jgi:hypothetical protein
VSRLFNKDTVGRGCISHERLGSIDGYLSYIFNFHWRSQINIERQYFLLQCHSIFSAKTILKQKGTIFQKSHSLTKKENPERERKIWARPNGVRRVGEKREGRIETPKMGRTFKGAGTTNSLENSSNFLSLINDSPRSRRPYVSSAKLPYFWSGLYTDNNSITIIS